MKKFVIALCLTLTLFAREKLRSDAEEFDYRIFLSWRTRYHTPCYKTAWNFFFLSQQHLVGAEEGNSISFRKLCVLVGFFQPQFISVPVWIRSKAFSRDSNRARHELAPHLNRSRTCSIKSQKRYRPETSWCKRKAFSSQSWLWIGPEPILLYSLVNGVSNSLLLFLVEACKKTITHCRLPKPIALNS